MDISEIKTSLTKSIQQMDDYSALYKSYYAINNSKIKEASKELFEARLLNTDTDDFTYFVNEVAYDEKSGRTVDETVDMINSMKDGKLLDPSFMTKSANVKAKLEDVISPTLSLGSLNKMLNYVPTTWSTSSVGKGEFAFILLTHGATKPRTGGDLHYENNDIEIKANGSKMASQKTHVALSGIQSRAIKFIKNETGKAFKEIPPLTKKNILGFYREAFDNNLSLVLQFVQYCMSKTMILDSRSNFEFINDSYIIGDTIDTVSLFKDIGIYEFNYYKKHENFDAVLFMNYNTNEIMSVSKMDRDLIENFKLAQSYSFKSERIQTNMFTLKEE